MESCVTTGTGVAMGVDKCVEMPVSATPFAVRGGMAIRVEADGD